MGPEQQREAQEKSWEARKKESKNAISGTAPRTWHLGSLKTRIPQTARHRCITKDTRVLRSPPLLAVAAPTSFPRAMETPNANPESNLQHQVIAASVAMLVLSTAAVGLRFYTRRVVLGVVSADDCVILAALVGGASDRCLIAGAHYGRARSSRSESPSARSDVSCTLDSPRLYPCR